MLGLVGWREARVNTETDKFRVQATRSVNTLQLAAIENQESTSNIPVVDRIFISQKVGRECVGERNGRTGEKRASFRQSQTFVRTLSF